MSAITADTIGPIPPTTPDERDGATRYVCANGIDPDDVQLLLAALGLDS